MADDHGHELDDQHRSHAQEHEAAEPQDGVLQQDALSAELPAYPSTLLGDPGLGSRGNQPVRIAMMQRMQAALGNRALQRFVQRSQKGTGAESGGQAEDIGQRIQERSGGGSSLDPGVQNTLESHLGADMSGVRVHTDSEADHLSRSVDAVAFTAGNDIYFSQGTYSPNTQEGMHLLTHEAVHTVQQSQGPVSGTPTAGGVAVSDPSDSFEQEAESVATQVSRMRTGSAGDASVQRSALPVYMQRAFSGGHTSTAEYDVAIQAFKGQYSNSTLGEYQAYLGEASPAPIPITQRSPLKTIRRMGRASSAAPPPTDAGPVAGTGTTPAGTTDTTDAGTPTTDASAAPPASSTASGTGTAAPATGPRTTRVGAKEADTFIRGRFGSNLAEQIKAGTQVEGRMNLVEEAAFRAAYERTYGSIDADYPDVNAFVDRTVSPAQVYVHTGRAHVATVIHEGLHIYSNLAVRDTLKRNVNEGFTEYFTRQLVTEQNLPARTGIYDSEYDEVNALAGIAGDTVMRGAYFDGNIAGLRTAVDGARSAGTFDNWAAKMQIGNWSAARAALAPASSSGSSGSSSAPATTAPATSGSGGGGSDAGAGGSH